jgi:hypothetical protein
MHSDSAERADGSQARTQCRRPALAVSTGELTREACSRKESFLSPVASQCCRRKSSLRPGPCSAPARPRWTCRTTCRPGPRPRRGDDITKADVDLHGNAHLGEERRQANADAGILPGIADGAPPEACRRRTAGCCRPPPAGKCPGASWRRLVSVKFKHELVPYRCRPQAKATLFSSMLGLGSDSL